MHVSVSSADLIAFLRHTGRFWPRMLLAVAASALACSAYLLGREQPGNVPLTVVVLMFLGGGACVGLALAALAAARDDRIYSAADLPPAARLLVEIPKLEVRRSSHAAL
jgi:hypothetical protein